MKSVVMGTAGHIDHGKTTLVKRLTGIDADRLKEEKKRGMTIELGFAPFKLPSGNTISIIDVPGHERFVKTMVAGVTGIDFVMLVIAADEGVMPQTREHIDILSLLNVNTGVVALTKSDLVDDEWMNMVKEDVANALCGTALKGIPIIPVSSVTGYGIDILSETLEKLSEQASQKSSQDLFRLPVDRVFTMPGHGTVITGTISGGSVTKGDTIELLPSGLKARVRNIQVHSRSVELASAGDRCALNLAGIEKTDIERGNVAASPGVVIPTRIVDAVVHTVKENGGIKHNQRVHAHIGTQEVMARVRIIGADEIHAGEKGYVQLRFEKPVIALRGDRFIVRSYSPVTTLGGGWVLFHAAPNRSRFSPESVETLTIGERKSPEELVPFALKLSGRILRLDDLWVETTIHKSEIERILADRVQSGQVLCLREVNKYLSRETYESYAKKLNIEFERFYRKYPYRYKIDKEEIKSKVFSDLDIKDFTALLNRLVEDDLFELDNNFIKQPGKTRINQIFAMNETGAVERELLKDGLNIRNIQQLSRDIGIDQEKISEVEKFLLKEDKITDLSSGILVHNDVLKQSVIKIRIIIEEKGGATAAEIRDCLGIGRKVAVALAEYLDSIGITERIGDIRKPGVHYMDYFI